MPFKHRATRRHHVPEARYRIRNWPAYEAGLERRGDLTFWLDETALAGQRDKAALAVQALNRMIHAAKSVSVRIT